MRYSKHASKRSQQRALPEEVLNLVMALGEDFKSYRGTRIKALVSKFAKNEFLQELKLKGILQELINTKAQKVYLNFIPYFTFTPCPINNHEVHPPIITPGGGFIENVPHMPSIFWSM